MQSIDGYLDNVVGDTVEGWAINREFIDSTQIVSIFIDGIFIKNVMCDRFRKDLMDAGLSDGHHAFMMQIPAKYMDGQAHEVDVRVGETHLQGSPQRVTLMAHATASSIDRALLAARSEIEADFDVTFYTNQRPQLNLEGLDPIIHYLSKGWQMGLEPTANFSSEGYLQAHEDVRAEGMNPFWHYVKHGRAEGRAIKKAPSKTAPSSNVLTPTSKKPELTATATPAATPMTAAKPTTTSKASSAPFGGSFEAIEGGWIKGWAWNSTQPETPIMVTCIIDEAHEVTATAHLFREDLKRHHKGDGNHAFKIAIPAPFLDGKEHRFHVAFTDSGAALKNSPRSAIVHARQSITGSLDAAEYPEVRGWAWDEAHPEEQLNIDIIVDNELVTTVLAGDYRTDLANANIGDGRKSFRAKLNLLLDPAKPHTVSAVVNGTQLELKKSPRQMVFPAANSKFSPFIERSEGSGAYLNATANTEETVAADSLPPQHLPAQKSVYPDAVRTSYHLRALRTAPAPTIIIPIYNAYEEVELCLRSVIENTTIAAELLLINDCSTDKRIAAILKTYAKRPNVTVLTNKTNLGFTKTVNRGIEHAEHDVVFLNSDTEVTPRWLEKLMIAAYQDPNIATVTAISDNIGAFSVPFAGENVMPEWLSRDAMGRVLAAHAAQIYPEAPTGNGFCLYIKREVIDTIGALDDEGFPRGYGEENDFCMRAINKGWRHVVDDSTFVYHKRSASFGDEKKELIAHSSAIIHERYPDYKLRVQHFSQSPAMLHMRKNVVKTLATLKDVHTQGLAITPDGLPRILYVLHGGATGGTPQTNADLMHTMQGIYDTFVLDCDMSVISLKRYIQGVFYPIEQWTLPTKLTPLDTASEEYDAVLFSALKAYHFELVHIRHMYRHTLSLPRIARTLNIPVVLSFHDFYYVCPTINLLDEAGNYCAGVCTKTQPCEGSDCATPFGDGALPQLKHEWVYQWRARVRDCLPFANACVTTCDDARSVYQKTYPELKEKPFHVIEHGRDFSHQEHLALTPSPKEKLRILIPGHLTQHKGGDFIGELLALDLAQHNMLEFHFLGNLPPRYQHLGTWYGTYKRDEFQQRVQEIGCHVMGIFSVWAETYCHTLSESWACGVPVVASHYGALGDRIHKHGGGWLVDITRPDEAYRIICSIPKKRKDFKEKVAQASIRNIRTTQQMGTDYQEIYTKLLNDQKIFAPKIS